MTRNSIVFVLASLGILIGWQFVTEHFFSPKTPVAAAAGEPTQAATIATAVPAANAQLTSKPAQGAPRASLKEAPERLVQVETAAFSASVSSWGARVVSLKLKGVKNKGKNTEQDMDLVPTADGPLYGAVELPGVDLARLAWTPQSSKPVQEGAFQVLRFFVRVPGTALEITKAYRFEAEGKVFHVDLLVRNLGSQTLSLGPLSFCWGPNIGGDTALMGQFPPAGVVQLEGKIEREKANDDTQVLGYAAPKWVALKDHYFVVGYFPAGTGWTKAEIRRLGQGKVVTALVAEGLTLAPAATQALSLKAYAGPQDFDALKTVGFNFQRVVQFQFYQIFDWLNPLSVGLLHVLKWFHKITGNWGIGIILLTLLVRGLMFWPSLKSMVSMRRMQTKMAAMQPRLATLKKVYKDDPNKLNQEMMKLYKEYGVNPLGGCLPMLLQIPIFFALYGTLSAAFELRGAPFFWKWEDLTAGDPTHMFPIAMGVTMFLQQKLAPTSATMSDEQAQMQKMMLWMMPIMFTGMALFMHWPVGLLLYWTASNIFGILQQLAVNKAVD